MKIKNKLIIITEITDSVLMEIANKYKAEIIEHRSFIGGRYSVLSETGMFPAALMGLDIRKFGNLNKLIKEKGVILKQFPEEVIKELKVKTKEVIEKLINNDKKSKKIYNHYQKFRDSIKGWSDVSDKIYYSL